MIIDAHQHLWQYDPVRLDWIDASMGELRQDWLPAQLIPHLQAKGVDATIAVQATGDNAETEFLLQQATAYEWVAGVVGWVDLRSETVAERLATWRDSGPLVGIRHQIEGEPACLDDVVFDAGVRVVQQQEMVYEVLIHHSQLEASVGFCARHDRHTLVLDHLAKPPVTGDDIAFDDWRAHMKHIAALPHVAVKMSGLVTEAQAHPGSAPDMDRIHRYLDTALELFGEDRLLYGSDWPVCRLAAGYDSWFDFIDGWARQQPTSLYAKLFGANAARIYALQP